MRVREVIEALQLMPPEFEVLVPDVAESYSPIEGVEMVIVNNKVHNGLSPEGPYERAYVKFGEQPIAAIITFV